MNDDSPQSKGGRSRADQLTPEERKGIASRAARARWTVPKSDTQALGEFALPKATHQGKMAVGGLGSLIRSTVN